MPWFGGHVDKGGPPWAWAGESADGQLASMIQEVPQRRSFGSLTLISTEMPIAPAQAPPQIPKLEEIE